jgi:hypothetical protein
MTYTLTGAARVLHGTGEALSDAGAAVAALDPGPWAFGAGGPGALGGLGRDLHALFQRALEARAREAAAHGARLASVADAMGRAGGGYTDVDAEARSRQPEVP